IVSEAKKDNYIDENNTTQASEVRVIVEGKKDAPAALKHFSDYVKNKNISVKIITAGNSANPSGTNTDQKPAGNSGVDTDNKTDSKDNGKGQEKNNENNNKKDTNTENKGSEKNNSNNKDQSKNYKHNTSKTSFSDIYNAKFNKKNK
ncbi:MAG: hypothetical protein Q8930_20600, partial [Bacillota bacterium]|nr:hypothetical protein [Bacillota bacterium]